MPDNLLQLNSLGESIGIDLRAVKNFILRTTPYHLDLESYLLVHYRAKTVFLEELAKQTTAYEQIIWTKQVIRALKYIEHLINRVLESDETTYNCNKPYEPHLPGIKCPNREGIDLPDPETIVWEDLTSFTI